MAALSHCLVLALSAQLQFLEYCLFFRGRGGIGICPGRCGGGEIPVKGLLGGSVYFHEGPDSPF